MKFELVQGSHTGLTLSDGRRISLDGLHQTRTYGGFAGRPTAEVNAMLTSGAVERAKKMYRAPVFVIPPEINAGPRNREELPSIESFGLFKSTSPVHQPDRSGSALCLLWYQPEYGLPVTESFFAEVLRLEWAKYAKDFDL